MNLEEFTSTSMSYSREELERIIQESCAKLNSIQPMLFDQKSDINERTVSAELASLMREQITELHINCEYNRMTDEYGTQIPKRINLNPNHSKPSSVFPDIIIHRQEDGEHNLLIIEIKMMWKNDNKDADFKKLDLYMQELDYQFGLYLELGTEGSSEMQWFTR